MAVDLEHLINTSVKCVHKMDWEDLLAWKLCMLSTGALVGLSLRSRAARRITALGCTLLSAGLALPLTVRFLDELEAAPPAEPMAWDEAN